ncbi:MAG: O-antigen translocase [Flavobacteriales bacterium AspAUS03]
MIPIKKIYKSTLNSIRNFSHLEFIKISSLNLVSAIIGMFTGLLSVKIISIWTGAGGVVLAGQFKNFLGVLQTVSGLGMDAAVTKYIAEYKDDPLKQKKIVGSSFCILMVISLIIAFLLMVFSNSVSTYLFGIQEYSSIIQVLGCVLLFFSLKFWLSAIASGKKYYTFSIIINITTSLLTLIFSSIFIFFFKEYGLLLSLVLIEIILFLLAVFLIRKRKIFTWSIADLYYGYDRVFTKKLLSFTLMIVVSTLAGPPVNIFIRRYLIEKVSLNSAGIWEGMNRISNVYLVLIISTLRLYYFPRLSEIKTLQALKKEVLLIFKILLPPLLLFLITIFYLKKLVISILFTSDFQSMEVLFLPQMIGDFFEVSSWILVFLMMAKAKVKMHVFSSAIAGGSFLLLSILLIDMYGMEGATYSYAMSRFFWLIINLILISRFYFFNPKNYSNMG